MMIKGGRMGCGALMLLLVSLGAAVEVFEASGGVVVPEVDLPFEDNNVIDKGGDTGLADQMQTSDVMMNRLLYMMTRDLQLSLNFLDNGMGQQIPPPDKRLPSATRSNPARPQRKWKIKKGRALASQMVCYFKLCTFRSPTH